MKTIVLINRYSIFNEKENIFKKESYPIGENLNAPFVNIKEYFKNKEIKVTTLDIAENKKIIGVIFFDYPNKENEKLIEKFSKLDIPIYLVILESPIICVDNFQQKNLQKFTKIFTWKDDMKGKNIYNLKLSNKIPEKIIFNNNQSRKLCTMISGNKIVKYKNELYSERKRALEWFEKYAKDSFDLYGIGWDRKIFGNILDKFINRSSTLKKIFISNYKTYRGKVEKKIEVLAKYKFSICYENVEGYEGYISEKIFDCFFAGTIPIYLGAKNIEEFIPKNCFILKSDFKTYDELYNYINNMSIEEYNRYISNIRNFVEQDKCKEFNSDYIGEKIFNIINEDLKI